MSGQATAVAAVPAAAPATAGVTLSAGATTAVVGGAQASRAVPGIKYRHVGKSGLVVSNLALGNVTLFLFTYVTLGLKNLPKKAKSCVIWIQNVNSETKLFIPSLIQVR